MKKFILKIKGIIPLGELERIQLQIKNDFDKYGFIVVDDRINVVVIDTNEDDGWN